MKKRFFRSAAFWVLLSEAVGLAAGLLTRDGTRLYSEAMTRPPLSPPAIVFPIVWTVLYALMGLGASMIFRAVPSKDRTRGLRLYFLQLAVNFLWPLLFFNLQAYGISFLWLLLLWFLVFAMFRAFGRIAPLAAKLQLPYLVWLTFAAYLNLGVWYLNP